MPIIQPGEIPGASVAAPTIRLAAMTTFADRARRFEQLAAGHAMAEYLRFLARISGAQQAALEAPIEVSPPDRAFIERARTHGMPPLAAQGLTRGNEWREHLAVICEQLRPSASEPIGALLDRLRRIEPRQLEGLADALLALEYTHPDVACAPIVAAALQVYWQRIARELGASAFQELDVKTVCPACGMRPVASVVRIGGAESSLRFLHCSLCDAEWHMVRIKCSSCESTKGIQYHSIEGKSDAARAETCEECKSYLKILYMEKDPAVDAVADDLATLQLDILVDEAGYNRSGPNLLLVPGSA
jgi:FdhE protein